MDGMASSNCVDGAAPESAPSERSSNFPYRLAVAIGSILLIGSFIIVGLIESAG